jgi:hypothetical protein
MFIEICWDTVKQLNVTQQQKASTLLSSPFLLHAIVRDTTEGRGGGQTLELFNPARLTLG